jgi:hypothetical protein
MSTETIELSNLQSTDCGGEFEYLMNDNIKKKGDGWSNNHDDIPDISQLDELTNLDEELHNLSFSELGATDNQPSVVTNELFSVPSLDDNIKADSEAEPFNVKFAGIDNINLESSKTSETWDGYSKFNNIPINPNKPVGNKTPSLSKEEIMEQKFEVLQKIRNLEARGVQFSKHYTMESSLPEMQADFKASVNARKKRNAVKGYGEALLSFITTIEQFSVSDSNPFDINLDGFYDKVSESVDMGEYEDDFEALHEKYKGWDAGPELNIAYKLGMGGALICATNSMMKSAPPGMERVFRENPDLMRNFQAAAVNTMKNDSNPAMSQLGSQMGRTMGASNNHPRTYAPPPPMTTSQKSDAFANEPDTTQYRPEMTGPGDISDILNSYKTSPQDIFGADSSMHTNPPPSTSYQPKSRYPPADNTNVNSSSGNNNSSTISISDLKELQTTTGKGKLPKQPKKKKNSRNSTISINI